ncbi:ATP-dependent DNA ligase [Stieleria neptunia]|uniref:ATP-dependent DNA ligase n=1 Tax=Stieleria neptunia TaxID=2527979 RepID=A0A518HHU2_9BACT|nr:ligase-associated DNA damage response endonuclease PdeM [Stieleria neptunia]QDV40415.1 ATP-dependent DNA ligase [Stieleria neptunia]
MEHHGEDVRALRFVERRARLDELLGSIDHPHLEATELIDGESWEAWADIRTTSRQWNAEGLMLKRKDTAVDMLLVADTHLGKDATFRRHGIPVPVGSTKGTLSTIAGVLRQTCATRLCILGDLFHARSSLSTEIRHQVDAFFDEFAHLKFSLIWGNHDAQVGRLPAAWPITVHEPGWCIGSLALGLHPMAPPEGADLSVCGHLHPAIRYRVGRESTGKLSCFWYSGGCLVLPAIGEFTGTHLIRPRQNDSTWFIAGNEVYSL